MEKKKTNRTLGMSYQDRLRNYEQDKQHLLATMAHLPANEFARELKALQDKWRI